MEHRKKILIIFLAVLVLILSFGWWKKNTATNQKQLSIGKKATITVDIADNDLKRQQGYSNHPPISFQEGMLFTMPNTALHTFWMKDMLFDLDFIYLHNNKVVDLVSAVPAPLNNNGQVKYINPSVPTSQILEVKSGFIKKYNIRLNDSITFN